MPLRNWFQLLQGCCNPQVSFAFSNRRWLQVLQVLQACVSESQVVNVKPYFDIACSITLKKCLLACAGMTTMTHTKLTTLLLCTSRLSLSRWCYVIGSLYCRLSKGSRYETRQGCKNGLTIWNVRNGHPVVTSTYVVNISQKTLLICDGELGISSTRQSQQSSPTSVM